MDLSHTAQRAGSASENNTISGFELASGGAGDDMLRLGLPVAVGSLFSQLPLGRGDDRLSLAAEVRVRFLAGPGNDVLSGSDGRDTLEGGSGRDRVRGGAGNDELRGGKDRDSLDGGAGRNRIYGGSGDDRITAVAGPRHRPRGLRRGPGDSLRADRRDRVRRCERVRRR